ncbi:protein NLRC3-like isoform X1 [Melanotaenia boesemani]|uniref:protein NLRC3-like isoform X1 n=1 Tax=Melanotaenia boesemani TaxID=1250792 RepID=UPI001C044BBA|nr:protein NLRC3-like isoform X1 [Melanotaenia boesemani]
MMCVSSEGRKCVWAGVNSMDREEGAPPSKSSLCGEHEREHPEPGPGPKLEPGPGLSCLSFQNDRWEDVMNDFRKQPGPEPGAGSEPEPEPEPGPEPEPEPSCVSMKSNESKDLVITFGCNQARNKKRPGPGPRPAPGPGPCRTLSKHFSAKYKPGQRPAAKRIHQDSGLRPEREPSCVSMKSNQSKDLVITFGGHQAAAAKRVCQDHGPESGPGPSCVSYNSNRSKDIMNDFKRRKVENPERCCVLNNKPAGSCQRKHSCINLRVDQQTSELPSAQFAQQHQTQLDSIFMLLEDNIITFVKNELKKIQKLLSPVYPECSDSQREDEEVLEAEEQRRSSIEAFVKITVDFLRRMKQEELAEHLQSKSPSMCQHNFKSMLKKKFQCVFEGIAKAGNPTLLNQIYTELYITEGETAEVNDEHEVRQIETASKKVVKTETRIRCEDIFKLPPGRDEPIRTVMTKGVAGIGKTVLTQKFTLDWAEDKANQDIQFLFPLTFRELNVLKERKFSLVELVHHFFTETKEAGICSFEEFQVVFILDGLDESRLPLDFHNNETLTDVTESTSVDVLLTNLIRGNLLSSARLWITTRPAAANQIPPDCVDMTTEVRGFIDEQKDDYFRKRFTNEKLASKVVSHIKTSRSLHIMCHIPVFCWITATVLEDVLETREGGELPKTLTEMYIHFLVVQTKVKKVKYDGGAETDPHWSPENRKMIESLGKLAFDQLQKGNLIFYESDLTECGIDITAASDYSRVFTQIFKEERGLYQEKVFSFIHLSVQEFLAALHVHLTFIKSGVNVMEEQQTPKRSETIDDDSAESNVYRSAVDQALQSPKGHLDLFLRFLLGLSLQTNQSLLRGLMTQTGSSSETNQETVQYIKKKISESQSVERSINLFHCLNELNDSSLVEEIQQSLRSGSLSTENLSPAQWSALAFILLSSEQDLDVFDLKKYSASEEALLRLLPVVKASKKAQLSGCNLSERSCEALSSVLSSQSSSLRELDLSNNDLQDSGVKKLCGGLESPHCKLESLSLSGCLVTEEGCASLVSALTSNPSHLRELDLSYNHPGESGVKLLTAGLYIPQQQRLDALRAEPGAVRWLKPNLRKYFCELTLDPNTAHKFLKLSENNKKVTDLRKEHLYPEHPDRFDYWPQVLCENVLTSRCYWEVEWVGKVYIAVSYRGIGRNGDSDGSKFGGNDKSWCLTCTDGGYNAWHNNSGTPISSSSVSSRVAVYVDCPAGTLSFYRVSSDSLIHLHTFNTTFTQPLYAGFGYGVKFNSSAFLCQL